MLGKIHIFVVTVLLTVISINSLHAQKKEVLIIHSYHQGLEWTDDVTKALENVFLPLKDQYELHFEYMDSKRYDDKLFLDLATIYSRKYKSRNISAVIISDNAALDFIKEYRSIIAPKAPIIFCGINDYSPAMIEGVENITGITESSDYAANIELMIELHPNLKKIIVVNDNKTLTSKLHKKLFSAAAEPYTAKVNFGYWEDLSIEEIEEGASKLKGNVAIFLINFHLDKNERYIDYSEIANKTSKFNNVPVYGPFTFFLGKGIVGGMLTSGSLQGEAAAQLTIRIMNGEKASDIPVITSNTNQYMFDYNKLKVFNININQLPKERVIINYEETGDQFALNRKDYAIFFATDNYDDQSKWSNLKNPIKDATAIATILHDKYGFDTVIIRNPTLLQIEENMKRLCQINFSDNDQMFMFFSGHGYFYDDTKEGFIVSKDSKEDYTTTYFPYSRLRDMLTKQPCKHIFLVLDVCYSGTFFNTIASSKGENEAASKGVKFGDSDSNTASYIASSKYITRMVMTSSGKETVSDGIVHSPFATELLRILRTSNQSILTAYDLMQAVQNVPPFPKIGAFEGNEPGSNFYFIMK